MNEEHRVEWHSSDYSAPVQRVFMLSLEFSEPAFREGSFELSAGS